MKILSLFTNENRNEHDKTCKAIISTEKIYPKFLFALFTMQEYHLVIEIKNCIGKQFNRKIFFHTIYNHTVKSIVGQQY